jgi:hypothetical protein
MRTYNDNTASVLVLPRRVTSAQWLQFAGRLQEVAINHNIGYETKNAIRHYKERLT